MITEDYVSFETAKLLKEKGFDERCVCYYDTESLNKFGHPVFDSIDMSLSNSDLEQSNHDYVCYSAPTLQVAMKWLREVHNILLVVDYQYECDTTPYFFKIYLLGENGKPESVAVKGISYDNAGNPIEYIIGYRDWKRSDKDYKTYEQTCDAAIEYCLENLI